MLVINLFLVNQTLVLPILGSFTIRKQDVTTVIGGEHELVDGGTESEEEIEEKEIREDVNCPSSHLECHYLVDSVRSVHLNDAIIFLKQLFLKVLQGKLLCQAAPTIAAPTKSCAHRRPFRPGCPRGRSSPTVGVFHPVTNLTTPRDNESSQSNHNHHIRPSEEQSFHPIFVLITIADVSNLFVSNSGGRRYAYFLTGSLRKAIFTTSKCPPLAPSVPVTIIHSLVADVTQEATQQASINLQTEPLQQLPLEEVFKQQEQQIKIQGE
ncbi:unnamed protein product [Lactuca saligna]|uniref:Uncharacterized protein n=1 Tax=Lactuca saligna TaxID=75948 RepID=A0AA35UJ94_LACSI|nr:unnamed protein product [Lactuca saligna]